MTVPYVSTHARVLNDLAAHIAAGSAVQSFLGVAAGDIAAARALIVEIDGPPLDVRHLILAAPRIRWTRTPGRAFTGVAQCGVLICAPVDASHTDAEVQRAALNWYSPLIEHIRWTPRLKDIDEQEPVRLDVSDGLSGWMMAGADLSIEVMLP